MAGQVETIRGPIEAGELGNMLMHEHVFVVDEEVHAAFLKCAIEGELTPGLERVLTAVAEAHESTGVPITTHTSSPLRTGWSCRRCWDARASTSAGW